MTDRLDVMGAPKKGSLSHIETVADSMTTLGRVSVPEDVANAVSFLAGTDSDWVTGQVCLDQERPCRLSLRASYPCGPVFG
jgi:NAD(P)-dependent dehydrogenase (short-subunit alcohol dehydrogenase family)